MPSPRSTKKTALPDRRPFNVVVAGVGGQGILRTASLIAGAAHQQGFDVSVGETFGAPRRGGTVLTHIRLGPIRSEQSAASVGVLTGPLVPRNMADVLVGLEPLELLRAAPYLNPATNVLLNAHTQLPVDVIAGKTEYPALSTIEARIRIICAKLWTVDAVELAQKTAEVRTVNTVMVGVLAGLQLTPIQDAAFERVITRQFTDRAVSTINRAAYRLGVEQGARLRAERR
jgi:indolepyruvate ferredoxin oxidoreductase beta subunit